MRPTRLASRVARLLAPALLLLAPAAAADTLQVPGDWLTIQDAIDHAVDGDTIVVAPGTWTGSIRFLGKSIHLLSAAGPGLTILDAAGADHAVSFELGEFNAILEGFTVTGAGPAAGSFGIKVFASQPIIRSCRIVDNRSVAHVPGGVLRGGGLHLRNSKATIEDCVISDNLVVNSARAPGSAAQGGGVLISNTTVGEAGLNYLRRCNLAGNRVDGLTVLGGGVAVDGARLVAEDDVIVGNDGHGLHQTDTTGVEFQQLYVDRCVVAHNLGPAGMVTGPGRLDVERLVVVGNAGPGLVVGDVSDAKLEHLTLVGNAGTALVNLAAEPLTLRHAVVWDDELDGPDAVGPLAVEWSLVQGGWPGTSIVDADPLFVDAAGGDFTPGPGSPCLDAGDPTDSDPDLSAPDLGALFVDHVQVLVPGLDGSQGVPAYDLTGPLLPAAVVTVELTGGEPGGQTFLLFGLSALAAPFKGGLLLPSPDLVLPLALDASGDLLLPAHWPVGIPPGFVLYSQHWIPSAAGPLGFAASPGLSLKAF